MRVMEGEGELRWQRKGGQEGKRKAGRCEQAEGQPARLPTKALQDVLLRMPLPLRVRAELNIIPGFGCLHP